jgi:uncharacterized protein YlzI (FlbEa/FlbD family)
MKKYIILHNKADGNLIYLNPNFVESITANISKEFPGGTVILCTGRGIQDVRYWVAENVEEVREKVWGTI